jgi:hypothetical protein
MNTSWWIKALFPPMGLFSRAQETLIPPQRKPCMLEAAGFRTRLPPGNSLKI